MSPSATTERANTFVEARLDEAERLGTRLVEAVGAPDQFAKDLEAGLVVLADPEYLLGQQRVAPGLGPVLGVRSPMLSAVERAFRAGTRGERPAPMLDIAERLTRSTPLELHWFAFAVLARTIETDPERTWQIVRREAQRASDWITVDTLARTVARGVLAEPYRWAELDQLVYSPSRWERRLVGSTIASIPFENRRGGRDPEIARHALPILADLIGDAEPDVQKAISWALRSLVVVDAAAVSRWLETETTTAKDTDDGHRAWVIRDTLGKLPAAKAERIRSDLEGIRRRPNAPSTSRAASTAAQFNGLGVQTPPTERAVVERT